jgi:hypothetical protein
MKNEPRTDLQSAIRLTPQYLQKLKDSGFLYMQIKSYSRDHRLDFITPHYFILTPIKHFSSDPVHQEIYEPIGSGILTEWSENDEGGIAVLVALPFS